MSRGERRIRMQRMRNYLIDRNIYRWAASILGDLHELRIESPGGTDLVHSRSVRTAPVEAHHRILA